jgi:hypothetical protein
MVVHKSLIASKKSFRPVKAPLIGRFLFYIFILSLTLGAAAAQNTSENGEINTLPKKIQNCVEGNYENTDYLNQRFTEAINLSKWSSEFNLSLKHTIIIYKNELLFIYSSTEISLEDIKRTIDKKAEVINACDKISEAQQNSNETFKLIVNLSKPLELTSANQFRFIYPPVKNLPASPIENLARKTGPVLFITTYSNTTLEIEEIQRTVIHEGMHLFGQQELLMLEPENTQSRLSSREYLQQLAMLNDSFKIDINKQICLASTIVQKKLKQSTVSDNAILLNIAELIELNILNKDKYEIKDIENYWILVEGIPEYLDHQILMKYAPERLIAIYQQACELRGLQQKIFYPNLIGAAIFHGFDIINGNNLWSQKFKLNEDTLNNLEDYFKQQSISVKKPGYSTKVSASASIHTENQIKNKTQVKIKAKQKPMAVRHLKSKKLKAIKNY